jgi:site-specific DNA recombinase
MGTKRYRYYVCTKAQKRVWHNCPSKSIPAPEIERFVVEQIKAVGRDPAFLHEVVDQARVQAQSHLAQLDAEDRSLERDLAKWNTEVRRLVSQIRSDDRESPAIARLADLQDRIRSAERRATEVREQVVAINRDLIDHQDVAKAMSAFDPVWESLTLREQARIVQLLVERVDFDGSTGKVAITFHPSGIKTLANEVTQAHSEDAA